MNNSLLYGPDFFKCKHKHLNKSEFSNSTYKCNKCNQEFTLIPSKNEPIIMPNITHHPRSPSYPPKPYFPKNKLDKFC